MMEIKDLEAALATKSSIIIGPQNSMPYIWANAATGEIRLTTDNQEFTPRDGDIFRNFLFPLSQACSISKFSLSFHMNFRKGRITTMAEDFDLSFCLAGADNKRIAKAIAFIQATAFPNVKHWTISDWKSHG
jgi:hypothetical protein